MPDSTPASIGICRVAGGGLVLLGIVSLAFGVIFFPPVLETHFLVDAELGSTITTIAAGVVSLAAIGAGLFLFAAATRLWTRARHIPARRVQLVVLAAAFSSTIVLLLVELTTRIAVPPAAFLSGDDFWIHRYVEAKVAESSEGRATFKSEFPMDRFDAELGWAPREDFRSDEVNINGRGVRGLYEDPDVAPQNTKRIVIIGDSFTFGEGVADADTYSAILETMLEGTRVINLGVLGFGTDQQLLRLKRSAFQYQPDLIILGFFGPNADRNVLTFRDAPKPMFELAGDGIELVNTPVPGPEVEWDYRLPWLRSLSWARTLVGRAVDRTPFAAKWEITTRILSEIQRACEAQAVPLMIAFYPDKNITFMKTPGDAEIVVESWARRHRVRFFSVRPAFSRLVQEERARIFYGHWTPYGNRFVATLLAAELEKIDY